MKMFDYFYFTDFDHDDLNEVTSTTSIFWKRITDHPNHEAVSKLEFYSIFKIAIHHKGNWKHPNRITTKLRSKVVDTMKFLGLKDCTLCGLSNIEDERLF